MNLDVNLSHVAACANKFPQCLQVSGNHVAYGCSKSVIVLNYENNDKKTGESIKTYNLHASDVTALRWIYNKAERVLISGSSDGNILCWSVHEEDGKLSLLSSNMKHAGAISSIDGVVVGTDQANDMSLVLSSSGDSTVKVWSNLHSSTACFVDMAEAQTIDFKNKFVLDVRAHLFPATNAVAFACACDDFKISIYVLMNLDEAKSGKTPIFELCLRLSGHEDWVRKLDFVDVENDYMLLSSCSQDSYIRIWKIQPVDPNSASSSGDDRNLLQTKKEFFSVPCGASSTAQYSASIEAVLSAHENWVYSANWNKSSCSKNLCGLRLLSASIDKTIVLWKYDPDANLWIDDMRVGEVGGNTLGFYNASFMNDEQVILGHSFSGALHSWKLTSSDTWQSYPATTGHMSVVNDIDWEPKQGRYLLSTSADQTTRAYAECKTPGSVNNSKSWCELARPQVHGYDLQCVGFISTTKFVSGADEKVLRVFDASQNFLSNFQSLTGLQLSDDILKAPEGASVPALGLSNRAVFQKEEVAEAVAKNRQAEQYIDNLFISVDLEKAPSEIHLLQNTLWPECRKLYGHVYEIFCLAVNHSGSLVASSGKSSQLEHSGIFIWDSSDWSNITKLYGHKLTVTQMEFSPDDRYLLSVSRDRTWILHSVERADEDGGAYKFQLVARSDKKSCHTRIIWSCTWAHDSTHFMTASRDKKIMLWKVSVDEEKALAVTKQASNVFPEPVTAVAFAQNNVSDVNIFAAGFESGAISIYSLTKDSENGISFTLLSDFNNDFSHCLTVKRLRWRPRLDTNSNKLTLASCSLDHQVKIFDITVHKNN